MTQELSVIEDKAKELVANEGMKPKEVIEKELDGHLAPLAGLMFGDVIPAEFTGLPVQEKIKCAALRIPEGIDLEEYVSSDAGKKHWNVLKTVKANVYQVRKETDDKGKDARSFATKLSKAIKGVADDVIAVVTPIESEIAADLKALKDADDERKRKNRERGDEIKAAIAFYTNYPSGYFNASAKELETAIAQLSDNDDEYIRNHFTKWDTPKAKAQGAEAAIEERDKAIAVLTDALEKARQLEEMQAKQQEDALLNKISRVLVDGLSGDLSAVNKAIKELNFEADAEGVTDNVVAANEDAAQRLIARQVDLEKAEQEKAEHEAQARKVQEAEQARLQAERDAADAKARAAQEEADRLRREAAEKEAAEQARLQAEKEAQEKAEAEAAEQTRLKALQPDKEKLQELGSAFRSFAIAAADLSLETEDAKALHAWFGNQVDRLVDALQAKAEEL